jgi:hypothetical protein
MALKFYIHDNKILTALFAKYSLDCYLRQFFKKATNDRGKPVLLVIAFKFPLVVFNVGMSKAVSQTFSTCHFLNVPFLLKLSLVKMSKFSH